MPGNNAGEVRCRGISPSFCLFLFVCMMLTFTAQAQWVETNGPSATNVDGVTKMDGGLYVTTYWSLFRSDDNGVSWRYVSRLPKMNNLRLDHVGNTLFMSGDRGLCRSIDQGATWIIDTTRALWRYRWLQESGDTIYVACNGLFRSVDHGATFVEIPDTSTKQRRGFHSGTLHNGQFFGATAEGVYANDVRTNTWRQARAGYTDCVASTSSILIASTYDTIYRSTVDGYYWMKQATPLYPWIMDAEGDDLFAITVYNGTFLSQDEGVSWRPLLRSFAVRSSFDLAYTDDSLYVTTDDGLYQSDRTSYEMQRNTTLPASTVDYMVEVDGQILAFGYSPRSFRYSREGGWADIEDLDTALLPAPPIVRSGAYLVARARNYGILHSTDQGASWKRTCLCFRGEGPDQLTTMYAEGDTVFLSNSEGLHRSLDNGLNWELGSTAVRSSTCIRRNGSDLWTATKNTGLWRSTDDGSTWTQTWSDTTLPLSDIAFAHDSVYGASVKGLLVFDANGSYAGRRPDSGFVSQLIVDNGRLIMACGSGVYIDDALVSSELPGIPARSLCILGDDLYVGFAGTGVWKHARGTISTVAEDRIPRHGDGTFDQRISRADRVVVADVLGNIMLQADGQSVSAAMATLPRGVYVVWVELEGQIQTLKVMH